MRVGTRAGGGAFDVICYDIIGGFAVGGGGGAGRGFRHWKTSDTMDSLGKHETSRVGNSVARGISETTQCDGVRPFPPHTLSLPARPWRFSPDQYESY